MKIGLISFQFDSDDPQITQHYTSWLIEALNKYKRREGVLPELVLSAGYTCLDAAGLKALAHEFGDTEMSLAVEMLGPADHPLVGSRRLKGCGQFYVVGRGGCREIEPRQQFSSTGNAREELAEKVVEGLGPYGGRRFSIGSKQVGWLECGEINVLCSQQDGAKDPARVRYETLEQRFFEAMTSLDIVLNPQHTRMSRLHLLRRKAEALSSGAIANAPESRSWPVYAGAANWNRACHRRSQGNLQSVISDGRRLSPRDVIETENYILSVYNVGMPQRSR